MRTESGSPDWKIDYKEIKFSKELGKGAFGIVFKGQWRHTDVAIKKLLTDKLSEKQMEDFSNEAKLIASLRPHKNIVQFYGVTYSPGNEICIGKKN